MRWLETVRLQLSLCWAWILERPGAFQTNLNTSCLLQRYSCNRISALLSYCNIWRDHWEDREGSALSIDLEISLKFVGVGRLKLHQAKKFSKMRFWCGLLHSTLRWLGLCLSLLFILSTWNLSYYWKRQTAKLCDSTNHEVHEDFSCNWRLVVLRGFVEKFNQVHCKMSDVPCSRTVLHLILLLTAWKV